MEDKEIDYENEFIKFVKEFENKFNVRVGIEGCHEFGFLTEDNEDYGVIKLCASFHKQ